MAKKYNLLIVLVCIVQFAYAQTSVKLNNNIFFKKLHNGLEVLVIEDHSVPLASLLMTFKAGAFTESPDMSGLTGLYQMMLTKANKDFANEQSVNYHAGQLGIKLSNTLTAQEYSSYYFTLPTVNLGDGLGFMNSAIRFPKLNQQEFEKTKGIINEQLKQKESSPYFAFTSAIDRHLWGDIYNRKEAIGNPEITGSATLASMQMIKEKFFYPNNALLVVGGDVAHETVFDQAEKTFGDWKAASFDPVTKWPVPEVKPLQKTDYFIVESGLATAPQISVNWQGPDTRGSVASTYAADVFSYLINQHSSQLNKALIQSGLATSMSIGYLTQKYGGPITLYVTPNPAKVKECTEEIKRQIALMDNDDYLNPEQIETAKRMLEIKKMREEEITTGYVHTLSFWWSSASLDYFVSYNDRLKKVSQADVRAYVQHYIKGQPYCAGLLISPELRAQTSADSFFKSSN